MIFTPFSCALGAAAYHETTHSLPLPRPAVCTAALRGKRAEKRAVDWLEVPKLASDWLETYKLASDWLETSKVVADWLESSTIVAYWLEIS